MKFVSYRRISTSKQKNDSQLGLIAQENAIKAYVERQGGVLLKDFVEVRTGTDRKVRPIVKEAMRFAQEQKATLVIAKLDRLCRSVSFLSALMDSNLDFVALDFPQADRMTLQIMAAVAEFEARRIKERINAALSVLKSRGVKLGPKNKKLTAADSLVYRQQWNEQQRLKAAGFAQKTYPTLQFFRSQGLNNSEIARKMNERGDATPSGKGKWWSSTVISCLDRVENMAILAQSKEGHAPSNHGEL